MSASTVAQVVGIVCYPIVAHLYEPSDVGALSVLLAVVGILTTIACGRYEQAIMVEHNRSDARLLWHLCVALSSVVTVIVAFVCVIAGSERVAMWFNTPALAPIVWTIAPLVWLSALGYVLTFVFNSCNAFGLTSRYTLVQGVWSNLLKIACAPLAGGLAFGSLGGHVVALTSVVRHIPIHNLFDGRLMAELRLVARRHWRFPVFNMPHALVSAVANNLPVLLLAHSFSPEVVGSFALCLSFGFKPVNVIAQSLNQAFFHSSGRNRQIQSDYSGILSRFVLRAILMCLPLSIVLYAFMPSVVCWLFGEQWGGAVDIMRALLPLFAMSVISIPLSFVPLMLRRQAKAMSLEMVSAVARTVALLIGCWRDCIVEAAWYYSIVHAAFMIVQVVWYMRLVKIDRMRGE